MSDDLAVERFLDHATQVEASGPDVFSAQLDGVWDPVFGGDTLARSVVAMYRTCEGKQLHSFHGRFLRPIPGDSKLELRVMRSKDGRRMSQRRIEVLAEDRLRFEATASFVADGEGHAFDEPAFALDVPGPEELPTERERARENGWDDWVPKDIEWRWPGVPWQAAASSHWWGWARTREPLAEDASLHAAALAFLSDFHCDFSVSRRLGGDFPRDHFLSLDHAMWIHRPPRWEGWLLVHNRSAVAHAGRALSHREIYTADGGHLASIVQEALLI